MISSQLFMGTAASLEKPYAQFPPATRQNGSRPVTTHSVASRLHAWVSRSSLGATEHGRSPGERAEHALPGPIVRTMDFNTWNQSLHTTLGVTHPRLAWGRQTSDNRACSRDKPLTDHTPHDIPGSSPSAHTHKLSIQAFTHAPCHHPEKNQLSLTLPGTS